jgi:MFS family permease
LGGLVYGLIAASTLGWRNLVVVASLCAGAVLLAAFIVVEKFSATPMMPLGLFRSRTFSGVNLLTLLLYGALGGAFFFLPFLLIQVHGYSATATGAIFLPFTLILGVLSRWSGGLVGRVGARGPLVIGPAIAGLGFGFLAGVSDDGRYWTLLMPMIVLGLGMAITVAPLTTTVVNAVPARQTGLASGINNAVASVAGLLAIAVLGTIAVIALGRALDHKLASFTLLPEVSQVIDDARGGFVMPRMPESLATEDRQAARDTIRSAYAATIRMVLLIAAGLAVAGALAAVLMIEPGLRARNPP